MAGILRVQVCSLPREAICTHFWTATDLSIVLWDLGSGRRIKTMTGHAALVNSLSFSAESSMLVSGSCDWTVRCWDVKGPGGPRHGSGGTDEVQVDGFGLASRGSINGFGTSAPKVEGKLPENLEESDKPPTNETYVALITSKYIDPHLSRLQHRSDSNICNQKNTCAGRSFYPEKSLPNFWVLYPITRTALGHGSVSAVVTYCIISQTPKSALNEGKSRPCVLVMPSQRRSHRCPPSRRQRVRRHHPHPQVGALRALQELPARQ